MNKLALIERVSGGIVGKVSGQKLQVSLRPDVGNADAISTKFKDLVLQTALKKFFKHHCFCIIEWDQICKARGIIQDHDMHEQLRLLHCVHWSEMSVELREQVVGIMMDTLSVGDTTSERK